MRPIEKVLTGPGGIAALALALVFAGGCAKAPLIGKSALRVVLVAASDCNTCGKASGYPLTYRVLQVSDATPITGTSLAQLWDKEKSILGPALLGDPQEAYVDPGQTKELSIKRNPAAQAIVVVGNFCRTRGSCWYYVQPLSRGGTVRITAGPSCFSDDK